MALKIKVIRDAGDVEKPDPIVNPYCTDLVAALQLGRVQIDLGSNPSPVTQKVVFTGEASVGWVCESYDRLNGAAWRGVVTGVQHGMDSAGKLITQINMLRGE